MSFSPVLASKHIAEKYTRYLHTIFSLDNDVYNKQLQEQLAKPGTLAAGPYLDVSDSFEKGHSLEELIHEGIIAEDFRKIRFPITRPLYKHQEIAIRKALAGENIIVSTGTGSGKTESFLIPILNHIIREHECGTLTSGVRALLIYPMNALANDQVERLRSLLVDCPEITYGSYTGQTKERYSDALTEYLQLNEGQTPHPNELISREQMKSTPPHILITNYAMLEYLMVRPKDNVFFRGEYADKWKFIVLDEAHVYNGSSGIEVSMLLRRLNATLQNETINYILTSATLGDEKTNPEVAEFGTNLCSSPFAVSNIVRAFRIEPKPVRDASKLPTSFYLKLAEHYNIGDTAAIKQYLAEYCMDSSLKTEEEQLYDIILHDVNYAEIRRCLSNAKTISQISKQMNWTIDELSSFVTVASKAEKNGDRLFDARYHMFLRATESVFITLSPSNKLFLERKKTHFEPDGTDFQVFEVATCNACHAIYLIGTIKNDHLIQSSFQAEDDLQSAFLLKTQISDTDDDHSMEEENIEAEEYELCARCGYIRRAGRVKKISCEHGEGFMVKVFKVHTRSEHGVLTKCPACENTNSNGILRKFFTGQEAVTSVIGTALFEELPSYRTEIEAIEDDDDSGFGGGGNYQIEKRIDEAKQFIAFSDNRQAAAFFASYFDQTYRNILYKRLIVETLSAYPSHWTGISIPRFVGDLAANFEKYHIAESLEGMSEKEAWKAILQEMVDNNGTTSLYSMGLVAFCLDSQDIVPNQKLGLSKSEVCDLCSIMALGMMSDAAINYDYNMQKADREFFAHNGVEYSYTLSDPNPKEFRRSFIPRFAGRNNKRADYFRRVLEKSGQCCDPEQLNKYLTGIWNGILVRKEYLKAQDGAYKIQSKKINIIRPEKWYICPKCKTITPFNVRATCPSYQCSGELEPVDIERAFQGNHYYHIYQELDIRKMRVVEHTAQLSRDRAYEYQKEFKRKKIDVLSCSTTFEMGVDVGTLETVFMRNMPPSPANYAQRAGRAGRSTQSAAFALTFCNKSSHDFSFFAEPTAMINGKINPPKFVIDNEKIAIRHVYASALAYFWKDNPQYFKTTSAMTECTETDPSGIDAFKMYLSRRPKELHAFIKRFLPPSLWPQGKFGVDSFAWVDSLFGQSEEDPGVLTKALNEYNYEVNILKEARKAAIEAGGHSDYLTERIKVYQNEDILSFLSRKNVMPKYGFPVDTVEMSVIGRGTQGKLGLQLQRDLSIAISEYAPGSQIVANGNLITSRYIRKIPKMSWKMYDYIQCTNCRTLNIVPHIDPPDQNLLATCHQCNTPLNSPRKVFLIPAFGFSADGDKIERPSLKKPSRTYHGEISYIGYRNKVDTQRFDLHKSCVEIAMSRGDEMAVINESNFFVCETCGYTDLDEKNFTSFKRLKHKNSAGYPCPTGSLKRFSLGYRFETDVLQLRFINPDQVDWEAALSLLYGIMRGICSYLNIEQDDISGCVQYFYNDVTHRPNYALVFYDRTPGGAGHVRRLGDPVTLEAVLRTTLRLMEACTCGGTSRDTSCYTCLRSYYNQKYHDILNRGVVIDFIKNVLK